MSHGIGTTPVPPLETSTSTTITSSCEAQYSRKKKSLGVLAETFLAKHRHSPPGTLAVIDVLAHELGVERRRIYDVVNILEAVKLVVKKGKNTYHWMGTHHLPTYFAILQRQACHEYPDDAQAAGLIVGEPQDDDNDEKENDASAAATNGTGDQGGHREGESPNSKRRSDGNSNNTTTERQAKSLSRLSQQFLQVFLAGNPIVSLADASDKIHGTVTSVTELATLGARGMSSSSDPHNNNNHNNHKQSPDGPCTLPKDPELLHRLAARGLKTKIRRLYDIANVLTATGYLTKVDDPPARPCTTNSLSALSVEKEVDSAACPMEDGGTATSTDAMFGYHHRRPYYKWVYQLDFHQIRQIGQRLPLHQTCPFTVSLTASVPSIQTLLPARHEQRQRHEEPDAPTTVTTTTTTTPMVCQLYPPQVTTFYPSAPTTGPSLLSMIPRSQPSGDTSASSSVSPLVTETPRGSIYPPSVIGGCQPPQQATHTVSSSSSCSPPVVLPQSHHVSPLLPHHKSPDNAPSTNTRSTSSSTATTTPPESERGTTNSTPNDASATPTTRTTTTVALTTTTTHDHHHHQTQTPVLGQRSVRQVSPSISGSISGRACATS